MRKERRKGNDFGKWMASGRVGLRYNYWPKGLLVDVTDHRVTLKRLHAEMYAHIVAEDTREQAKVLLLSHHLASGNIA